MIQSLFRMLSVSSWPEWAYEGDDQNEMQRFLCSSKNHVIASRLQSIRLNDGDVRAVSLGPAAEGGWSAVFATVVGAASITIEGVDFDGITPIIGTMASRGVRNFPGLIILNGYDTAYPLVINGLEDGTTVSVWTLKTVANNDPVLQQA